MFEGLIRVVKPEIFINLKPSEPVIDRLRKTFDSSNPFLRPSFKVFYYDKWVVEGMEPLDADVGYKLHEMEASFLDPNNFADLEANLPIEVPVYLVINEEHEFVGVYATRNFGRYLLGDLAMNGGRYLSIEHFMTTDENGLSFGDFFYWYVEKNYEIPDLIEYMQRRYREEYGANLDVSKYEITTES